MINLHSIETQMNTCLKCAESSLLSKYTLDITSFELNLKYMQQLLEAIEKEKSYLGGTDTNANNTIANIVSIVYLLTTSVIKANNINYKKYSMEHGSKPVATSLESVDVGLSVGNDPDYPAENKALGFKLYFDAPKTSIAEDNLDYISSIGVELRYSQGINLDNNLSADELFDMFAAELSAYVQIRSTKRQHGKGYKTYSKKLSQAHDVILSIFDAAHKNL